MQNNEYHSAKIAVIGLGYVGLPLAVEFGKKRPTMGFDIAQDRIAELGRGEDRTKEVDREELATATALEFVSDPSRLSECSIFIVTVPTPIDRYKRPDLSPLIAASKTVGAHLKKGDIVIYESTVYPGATEEDCVPVLEQASGLKFNRDFFAGYSPERINPGDKEHRLPTITKVTSGSTPEIAEIVDALYRSIITAGTHKAPSIKVAEAAKVIENTQRDLNIALINELSLIFDKMDIDTLDVLDAAGTKWNFLPFRPGLVGGHCIGVDPYYLTHKAQALGYSPDVVLAGRRINDGMGKHVADKVVRALIQKSKVVKDCRVLVLGLTFKENCPDLRNTRVTDIIKTLREFDISIDVYDPEASAAEALHEYGLSITEPEPGAYDAVILAVAHDQFRYDGIEALYALGKNADPVIFDLKGLFRHHPGLLRL